MQGKHLKGRGHFESTLPHPRTKQSYPRPTMNPWLLVWLEIQAAKCSAARSGDPTLDIPRKKFPCAVQLLLLLLFLDISCIIGIDILLTERFAVDHWNVTATVTCYQVCILLDLSCFDPYDNKTKMKNIIVAMLWNHLITYSWFKCLIHSLPDK